MVRAKETDHEIGIPFNLIDNSFENSSRAPQLIQGEI